MHLSREYSTRLSPVLIALFAICPRLLAGGTVHLDPTVTAEPISKYIYGQFTEHLGRSIYGGLWRKCSKTESSITPSPTTTHRG